MTTTRKTKTCLFLVVFVMTNQQIRYVVLVEEVVGVFFFFLPLNRARLAASPCLNARLS